MPQRPPAFRTMTEWKWEDAASRSPPSSVEMRPENIALAPAEYIKGGGPHSHIRGNPGVCCAKSGTDTRTTLASHWHGPSLLRRRTNVARRLTGWRVLCECCARENPL